MKNNNVFQKIGAIIFVIGIVGRFLGKLLGKEINQTLRYSVFISIFGLLLLGIDYVIRIYKKKNKKNEINIDSKNR